jgi:hypothetical protein
VYGFLGNTEQTINAGSDKLLPLAIDGVIGEQFYIAPDGNTIRKEIQELRNFRTEILPFMPDLKGN